MHPLNDALPGPYVPVRVPHSIAGLLFPSRCPSGRILRTPYSMVWDWRVSRAEPVLFYWAKLLYPYYNLLLLFPFSYFCLYVGIVGLGSRTDRVYITLSDLHCRPFLIIIIIMTKCWNIMIIIVFKLGTGDPLGGSEWIISVGDYVNNSFTALGSSDTREVRLEL